MRTLFGCEHPFDAVAFRIALFLSGGGLDDEASEALHAPVEALAVEDALSISTRLNRLAGFRT
ncbi:hypothetical protein CWO91_37640 [Bradyrhizobium genosp. SA-3]|nr:hypothetical protein CWO91_37640 [Bradyrhizobium genosp. SA-3]